MKDTLKLYQEHDIMTEIKTMKHMVADIPKDIKTIVTYVQNILLHQHWSEVYGLELGDERKKEPFIRSFEDKLVFLNKLGFTHVSEQRTNENKMISICRDFSIVAVALCREAGIPARARCGFASYLVKDKYIDHWVVEYWNEEKKKWVMVDAQLDVLQQRALQLSFDPLDVSENYFITGPRAWLLCREGRFNPELFGIFKWWGYDYLRCNLILDANSLLKVPMQPWDIWKGYKSLPIEEWTEKDYKVMDELSILALNVDNNYEALYKYVQTNDKIKVPKDLSEVINGLE
ncbi:transglutaminase [Tissierella sp. P1]|uniref:transglutaminase-like domain-containing protein n=1 Tax=Tissierella sp. P1 TaxID=1280483 RepID=UPI000BA0ADC8|nr:transglutaminase-like domain-containing protein [Tissierella sp. P1]OZV13045.1 transglutaminase [Tissierella sp. P1]